MQAWKSEIDSYRWGLRPYPLGFHVKLAGADAKLIQHGPLGVAYHRRYPISTVSVARITAHATVPSYYCHFCLLSWQLNICNSSSKAQFLSSRQVELSQVKFFRGELSHLQTWLGRVAKSRRTEPSRSHPCLISKAQNFNLKM
jgi:hypothetical protein